MRIESSQHSQYCPHCGNSLPVNDDFCETCEGNVDPVPSYAVEEIEKALEEGTLEIKCVGCGRSNWYYLKLAGSYQCQICGHLRGRGTDILNIDMQDYADPDYKSYINFLTLSKLIKSVLSCLAIIVLVLIFSVGFFPY